MKRAEIPALKLAARKEIEELQARIKGVTFKIPRRVIDGPLELSRAWKEAAIDALAMPAVKQNPGDSLTLPELRGRLQKLATAYQSLI